MEKKKESEWILLGRLGKNSMRGKNPLDSLTTRILELDPLAYDIQSYGVSRPTNKYLEKNIMRAVDRAFPNTPKKHLKWHVAMHMLNGSPCDLDRKDLNDLEDFYIYKRSK